MNIMQSKLRRIKLGISSETYEANADEIWSKIESKYNKVEKRLHILKKTKQKAPLCK